VLPIPATYVVGQDGIVRLAFVDSNYRNRLEPDAVVAALERLARQYVAA
jgi:peroxiredoxin